MKSRSTRQRKSSQGGIADEEQPQPPESARATKIRKAVQEHLSPETAAKRAAGQLHPEIDFSSLKQAAGLYKEAQREHRRSASASPKDNQPGEKRPSSASRTKASTSLKKSSKNMASPAVGETVDARNSSVFAGTGTGRMKSQGGGTPGPTADVPVSPIVRPTLNLKRNETAGNSSSSTAPAGSIRMGGRVTAKLRSEGEAADRDLSSTIGMIEGGEDDDEDAGATEDLRNRVDSAAQLEELAATLASKSGRRGELAKEAKTLKKTIAQVEISVQRALREFQAARSAYGVAQEEYAKCRTSLKAAQTRTVTTQAKIAALQERKKTTKTKLQEELDQKEKEWKKKMIKWRQKQRDLQMQLSQKTKELKRIEDYEDSGGGTRGGQSQAPTAADSCIKAAQAGATATTTSNAVDAGMRRVAELESELHEIETQRDDLVMHQENLEHAQSELEAQKRKLCQKYQLPVADADARFRPALADSGVAPGPGSGPATHHLPRDTSSADPSQGRAWSTAALLRTSVGSKAAPRGGGLTGGLLAVAMAAKIKMKTAAGKRMKKDEKDDATAAADAAVEKLAKRNQLHEGGGDANRPQRPEEGDHDPEDNSDVDVDHLHLAKQELAMTTREFTRLTNLIRKEQSKLLRSDRDFEQKKQDEEELQQQIRIELEDVCKQLGTQHGQKAERELVRRTIAKVEQELEQMETEFQVKKRVLDASARDIAFDLEERGNAILSDEVEKAKHESMTQLRMDQLHAFETRLAEHEETWRLKRNGLQNWLASERRRLAKMEEEARGAIEDEIAEDDMKLLKAHIHGVPGLASSDEDADGKDDGRLNIAGKTGSQLAEQLSTSSDEDEHRHKDASGRVASSSGRTSSGLGARKKKAAGLNPPADPLRMKYRSLVKHLAELETAAQAHAREREEQTVETELKVADLFKQREQAKKVKEKLHMYIRRNTNSASGVAAAGGAGTDQTPHPGTTSSIFNPTTRRTSKYNTGPRFGYIHEHDWVKSGNPSTQNRMFQLIERNRKEFTRLEEIYGSIGSLERSRQSILEQLDKVEKCRMLVRERLQQKQRGLAKISGGVVEEGGYSSLGGSGERRVRRPSASGMLETQERVENLLRNYDPKLLQDATTLRQTLLAKEKEAHGVEKEIKNLETQHAKELALYKQGMLEDEAACEKEVETCLDRVQLETLRSDQFRKKVEEVSATMRTAETQAVEKDRKVKFLQAKLSELRTLAYVIAEKRAVTSSISHEGRGSGGARGGGPDPLSASSANVDPRTTGRSLTNFNAADEHDESETPKDSARHHLRHDIKASKKLPAEIRARIEQITSAVKAEGLVDDNDAGDDDDGGSAARPGSGSARGLPSSRMSSARGGRSGSAVSFSSAGPSPRDKRPEKERYLTDAGTKKANEEPSSGAPASSPRLNSAILQNAVQPSQRRLPSVQTIQSHFGADHPAYLFYVHLLPLLKGVAVMMQNSKAKTNEWVPRIVSVSTDYGRVQFHSEKKMVAETFVRVRSLKSVNVPDPTLKLLQDVAKGAEVSAARGRGFHLHVLRFDGESVKMQVPTITTFHLLTQAFKILCETPKEQLSYFAVVLGLKST